MTPREVLDFWFEEGNSRRWFRSTPEFDREIRDRFENTWREAIANRLGGWEMTAEGALALVILLDQFPLNMFRGRAEGHSSEALARGVADRAIARGFDRDLDDDAKAFLYLPFMHSEDLPDQDRAIALFEAAGLEDNLRWARHHREIVRRFGRFPHRNPILGRDSTAEELAWLDSGEAYRP